MPPAPILRVALPTPLRQLFDYRNPGHSMRPGMRVRVPFGRQRLVGVVMATAETTDVPAERLKAVLQPLDDRPVFDAGLLELLRWAAGYYHHPIGEVVAAALPKALRLGASVSAWEERWQITPAGRAAHLAGEPKRSPRRQALLAALLGTERTAAELREQLGESWRAATRPLAERGWIESAQVPCGPPPAQSGPPGRGPALNEEQRAATERIQASLGRFDAFVLQGVTGSGKTEVYLRVTEQALALGRGALVLVPEIGLTPQLVGRFRERFGVPLAVLHSGLTDP